MKSSADTQKSSPNQDTKDARIQPAPKAIRKNTITLTLTAVIAALTCVGGIIKIEMPPPLVDITFQTFFACLAGVVLGSKCGALSQIVYIALGLMGLPIFSEGGGIMYVLKPSFGFLISFPFCSFVTGLVKNKIKKNNFTGLLISCLAGLAVVYVIGLPYMAIVFSLYLNYPAMKVISITLGTLLYLIGDVVTIIIIALFMPIVFKKPLFLFN